MKILRQTQDHLIVEHRPILFTGLFAVVSLLTFGWGLSDLLTDGSDAWLKILFGGIFMAGTLFMVERARLTLDAQTGEVEFRRVTVLGAEHLKYTLDEVSRFEIETSRSDDTDTHRLVLIIDEGQAKGRYPVTKSYYSWFDEAVAQATNDWLDRQKCGRDRT